MFKIRILALMVMAAILLLFPGVALGQQVPPHISAITATVDGAPAADGAEVTAWIDGEQVASAIVENGVAVIVISGDAGFTGKTISFKVDGSNASETDTWEQGGHTDAEFSINASSSMADAAAVVSTAWAGLSQYLVDGAGMTLYIFTRDTAATAGASAVSACTSDGCLRSWPPLFTGGDPLVADQPQFGSTADEEMLGTLVRADGKGTQVTYNGWPLYHYVRDTKAGDAIGQYGPWYALAPQGTILVGGTNVAPDAEDVRPGLPGDAGAAGSKGDQGDTGATGAAGSDGAAGTSGTNGTDGTDGTDGAKGDQGVKGDAGAAGSSGGSGLAVVALILAIVGIAAAGGAFMMGRRS